MGILSNLFNWFNIKDKQEKERKIDYVLENEPESIEDIGQMFKAFELEKYLPNIEPLVRPVIELELKPTAENSIKNFDSKIGGKPSLPKDYDWPKTSKQKSMSFIAQLNITDIKKHDEENLFPSDGIISFFYCADQQAWGFDPKDKNSFKVIYFNSSQELQKADFPTDLESESIFKPNVIKFTKSLSIPTWDDDSIIGLIEDEDSDNYFEVSHGAENQILGYANNIQNTMELECQLVTNGLYCGDPSGYNDPRRKELESGQKDWVLLLQVGSEDEDTGMMWGDLGRIYFWIKKQDLKEKNFDNSWCILQCS
ncbi:MAG: YwqG family protein [Winogradskyella arenosi]